MSSTGRPSINKRNREQARKERVQEKIDRRKRKSAERLSGVSSATGEDGLLLSESGEALEAPDPDQPPPG